MNCIASNSCRVAPATNKNKISIKKIRMGWNYIGFLVAVVESYISRVTQTINKHTR
jgi:hypothetical protein